MNLFQACQPGSWPSSSKMNRGGNKERVQPVILDMHSNPPILDTSLLDQTHLKTHTTQRKPPSEVGGLLWRQLNTVYQTFHKMWAAPVTWVNPEVMVDPQLHPLQHLNSQPYYPPITKALNPDAPLWFPAEPGGSHLDFIDPLMYPYMDPLNLMQEKGLYPYHMDPSSLKQCKGPYSYQTSHHTQPGKFTSVKVDKPLNPEAKEWVPNNYSCSSQAPVSSLTNSHMNEKRMETSDMNGIGTSNPGEIPIIPNGLNCSVVPEVLNDFCEITENEINAVRRNSSTYPIVTSKDKEEYKVDEESEMESTDLEESSPKDNQSSEKHNISESVPSQSDKFTSLSPPGSTSQRVREETMDDSVRTAVAVKNMSSDGGRAVAVMKNESLNGGTTAAVEKSESLDNTTARGKKNERLRDRTAAVKKNESLNGDISLPVSKDTTVCTSDNSVNDSSSLSYAKIVGRAPPSPPPSPESPDKSQDSSAKYEKVVQPLPKIFMKDKVYPKEKAPPAVDNKCKASGLFKTASKTQKATSKNFLKELKSSVKANENGINVDLICIELPESPPLTSSPKEETTLPLHCSFSISQKAHNNSECSSNDSRIRSVSESSTTSVDSLDVDFVDEVDNFKECKMLTSDTVDDLDKAVAKDNFKACKKPSPSSPKFSNVLACILGYDESESDESEDDEDEDFDDDWDKVCGENGPIDDTWETFEFGLIISGGSGKFPCTQVAVNQCNKNISKNQHCDNIPESVVCDSASDEEDVPVSDVSLEEINRKWEEEIEKDVLGQSERRVRFGGTSIHPMVTWNFARREARRGPWEQYARDRARFCQRIASLEPTLSLVLNHEHRDCVYKKMQQNSWPS